LNKVGTIVSNSQCNSLTLQFSHFAYFAILKPCKGQAMPRSMPNRANQCQSAIRLSGNLNRNPG